MQGGLRERARAVGALAADVEGALLPLLSCDGDCCPRSMCLSCHLPVLTVCSIERRVSSPLLAETRSLERPPLTRSQLNVFTAPSSSKRTDRIQPTLGQENACRYTRHAVCHARG
jgi:hypothetical protein